MKYRELSFTEERGWASGWGPIADLAKNGRRTIRHGMLYDLKTRRYEDGSESYLAFVNFLSEKDVCDLAILVTESWHLRVFRASERRLGIELSEERLT